MIRSLTLFHTCTVRKSVPRRLPVLYCRNYSSQNDSSDSGSSNLPREGQYIPQRIRKRLNDRGLSIEDLEYRPTRQSASRILEEAIEDQLVDKNVEIDFPSDIEKLRYKQSQEKFANRPPGIDPANTSILLFPGQGSQFVGMGKKLLAYPGVEDMYNKASEILGYDLLRMCISGPEEKLNKTIYCQPAVVVTSLAAVERLKEEYPTAIENCVGVAGFSVGEFTAFVHSGMISFEDAIMLIKHRAVAMQTASEVVPSGMLTVFCDHNTRLRTAMVAAREYCRDRIGIEDPVCQVANYLCTDVKVVAGHEEALDFLQKYGKEWGITRTKRLPVSGAFHTELMYAGKKFWKFWDVLEKVTLNKAKYTIHSNLDGKPYRMEDEEKLKGMKHVIKKQMMRPVAWEQIMHILFSRKQGTNFPQTFEVGPGRQLGFLLQKTNLRAFGSYKNIEC